MQGLLVAESPAAMAATQRLSSNWAWKGCMQRCFLFTVAMDVNGPRFEAILYVRMGGVYYGIPLAVLISYRCDDREK
jgi:hypothetical protein